MLENAKNSDTRIKVSDEVRKEIFKQVEDCYKSDVEEMIGEKKCWRRIGLTFETMSKVTVAVGGVLSFSSGYFGSNILSFISGSVSVLSLSLLQFGSFGFKQGKKQASDLNVLLRKLDLETVPVLENEPDGLINGNERKAIDKGFNIVLDESMVHPVSDSRNLFHIKSPLNNILDNTFRKTKPKINNITVTNETSENSEVTNNKNNVTLPMTDEINNSV
jgi:hypothetical protein